MGSQQNNPTTNKASNGKRGSVRNDKRLESFRSGAGVGSGDWGQAECGPVLALIVAITSLGGAVTFGLSRDGGAHMLTLLLGGDRETLWFNGDADLVVELGQVLVTLEEMK